MHLIQILLPLYDNNKVEFSARIFVEIRSQLAGKFGGITTYTRSPASGLWKETSEKTVRDDIVIYEVLSAELDRSWWKQFKADLEALFQQDEIIIRTWLTETL